jgi:phosphoglycolate phosphatase
VTESARVYDLDGTLVRLRTDWRAAERAVRAVFEDAPVSVETDSKGVWELFDVAEAHGLEEAVERRVAEYEREGARNAVRLPAADELDDLSLPVGVCSLNCEAACRIALETHDLADHVDVVVGRDTVAERKPHPEPLLAAVRDLAATPDAVLFVGDSESDAVCADRAGTRFAYVDGGPREY